MSDVERIFDRFIDAFADDLIAIAKAHIDVEVARALKVAQKSSNKQSKVELRLEKRSARLAAKAALKQQRLEKREAKRAARLAEKDRVKAARAAEKQSRQVEHDRLKQERLALKQELEAERRRLREASRKRPTRQLPLDFDGLRAPKPRRRDDRPAPGSPPPLFVHKRKRDGQIETLARGENAPPNGAPANGAPVTNGAAPVTNGAALAAPTSPAE
jgi:hypothetical protein